jgi:tRNA G18 (ribose-2'-O)-methylase SpoU
MRAGVKRPSTPMRVVKVHEITSGENPSYREWKQLVAPGGIRKHGRALLSGTKIVDEAGRLFPERIEALLLGGTRMAAPEGLPESVKVVRLPAPLFKELDTVGTGAPLLVLRVPEPVRWTPEQGLPSGLSVFLPFQDPENLGAAIRSSLAFGASAIVLLRGAAHPFHPKVLRASGGAVLRARVATGPALGDLPLDLPFLPLSPEGEDLMQVTFPATCALLPGIEGPGLPAPWRARAIRISIRPEVDSLNAAAALAIALYEWSRRRAGINPPKVTREA